MNSGIKIKNLFFQFFILRRGDLETGLESVELIFTGCNLFKKNMRLLEVLKAIELKIDYNAPDEYAKQKSDFIHPNWNLRFQLLSDYRNFNQDAIRYIAKEVGITDEKYIKK